MLRGLVITFAVLSFSGAVVVMLSVPRLWPPAVELFAFSTLLVVGLFFERHYRGARAPVGIHLQPTGEKFVDPTTGKLTEVLYDPKTGERIYRETTSQPR